MTEIMQPEKSSRENIDLFLNSIENPDLKQLLKDHLETILEAGTDAPNPENREAFFDDVKGLIRKKMGEENEN
jgi:spore coat protein CotF